MKRKWGTKLAVSFLGLMLLMVGCAALEEEASTPSSQTQESEASKEETQTETELPAALTVGVLKGPTGLGALQVMEQAQHDENLTMEVYTSSDEMVSALSSGTVDAACLPTNLAANLYQKTEGGVKIACVNTLGILSVVTNGETVNSIADLKGKTVVSSGQGGVPEFAFNYILEQNGLEAGKDVTVTYLSEHSEVAQQLMAGDATIAVLPEPFVTQVTTKQPDCQVALDLTEEWNKVAGGSVLSMGCLVVKSDYLEDETNKETFDRFLSLYQESVEFVNDNPEEAGQLSQTFSLMEADVAEKAIPRCNIVYIAGKEMKERLTPFWQVLYDSNPASIGKALPDDNFYYEAE